MNFDAVKTGVLGREAPVSRVSASKNIVAWRKESSSIKSNSGARTLGKMDFVCRELVRFGTRPDTLRGLSAPLSRAEIS